MSMYKKFLSNVSQLFSRRQSQRPDDDSTAANSNESSDDNLLTNIVPKEMAIDILLRLPIGSIIRCKFVCKSWRDLIECYDFVTTHHSKSISSSSGLALVYDTASSTPYKIYDKVGITTFSSFRFGFSSHPRPRADHSWLLSSVNGLICVCDDFYNVFICNPITREYIRVRPPPGYLELARYNVKLGFGASRVSGRYKVVVVTLRPFREADELADTKCILVCSLETRSWRSIASGRYSDGSNAALLNGNLHWLGFDFDFEEDDRELLISCFDLETEQFTSFYPPLDHATRSSCYFSFTNHGDYYLSALGGRLCFCDSSAADEVVIWFMNKYGDDNSWTKEFIINTHSLNSDYINLLISGQFFPVRVFRDKGILLGAKRCGKLFFYSNETKSIDQYDEVEVEGSLFSRIVNYNPSFLSLQNHGISTCGLVQYSLTNTAS